MKKKTTIILALTLAFALMLSACAARRPMYTNENGFDTTRNNIGTNQGNNNANMGRQQGVGGTGANYGANNRRNNLGTNNRDYPGFPTLPGDYGNVTGYDTNLGNDNNLANNRTINNTGFGNTGTGMGTRPGNTGLGNPGPGMGNTGAGTTGAGTTGAGGYGVGNNQTGVNLFGMGTPLANNNETLERTCEAVPGVQDATVVVTGNTCYVGIDSNNNRAADLTRIKREVADRIRSTNQYVNVVYVSENENFINRLRTVGDRMRNGNPGANLTNELNDMVRTMTPQTTR